MSRRIALAVIALASVAPSGRGAEPPERYLSPTTQLYVRWDGIAPHAAAYGASALGSAMKGPTGDTARKLLDKFPQLLGAGLLAEPLLKGRPLEELRSIRAGVKLTAQLPQLLADKGALVAVEVRAPKVTLGGIAERVGGALGLGNAAGSPELSFAPEVQAFLIVPDVGGRAEALFAPTRLYMRSNGDAKAVPLPAALGVEGFRWSVSGESLHMAEWVMGGHFFEYVGTVPVEEVVGRLRANAEAGGLTRHPLFERCKKAEGFESVCRGFAEVGSALDLVRAYVGPQVPGLDLRLRGTGAAQLAAVVFSSGFKGRESRAAYEFDLPGERHGLAKLLKRRPLDVNDLPPLPPDCSRFSALRVDWAAAHDGSVALVEALKSDTYTPEELKVPEAQRLAGRRDFLKRELDKRTGISFADDLLANLGDLAVTYQSPSEGLQLLGQCLAVSCRDPAAVRKAMDRMQRAVEPAVGRMRVRKKVYAGVEVRELYSRDFALFVPTYAVVGDWLVLAGHPQLVQGFILRHNGGLPRWKPDAATAARMAGLPTDKVGLQFCNPQSTVTNLCCVGPTVVAVGSNRFFGGASADEPFDVGMLPNAHELGRHLFPNLASTRDDGKTIRIDVNESFSLPLDCIGFDAFLVALSVG